MKKVNAHTILSIGILGFLILLFLKRACLSVELTDEAHGIASIYNIYQGKVPFMTSWDYHTGWCLLVPLFALFKFVSPELEGVIFTFRLFYIGFLLLSFTFIVRLLRQDEKRRYPKADVSMLWFSVMPAIFYVPFSLFQINYNSFTILILVLVSVILFTSVKEEKGVLRHGLAGVLMALDCIMYPTLAVMALLLILYLYFANKGAFVKEKIISYVAGGGLVTVAFLIWIFSNGTVELFKEALNGMFTSPHESSKGAIDMGFMIQTFYLPLKAYLMRRFTLVTLAFLSFQCFISVRIKNKREVLNGFLMSLYLIINAWCNKGQYGYMGCGILIAFFGSALILKRSIIKKYAVMWGILLFFLLIYSFTSDNKNVFVALEAASIMIIFLFSYSYSREFVQLKNSRGNYIILLLALSGVLNMYAYVYRDEPVSELTERVENGIYKGLYTTPERKQFVEQTESVLWEQTSYSETICVVTRAPMLYLMTKAEICAPQTWDAQFLARGYTSAAPLLNYFRAVKEEPEILAATTLDISDFYENSKYEINLFIASQYELFYRGEIEDVTIYLWRKKAYE